MNDVQAQVEEPVATQPLDAPPQEPVAEAAEPVDTRQEWYCVDPYGPRTSCPPFRSDNHVAGLDLRCPTCGSKGRSVIRAEQWEAGNPAPTKPRDPRVPL